MAKIYLLQGAVRWTDESPGTAEESVAVAAILSDNWCQTLVCRVPVYEEGSPCRVYAGDVQREIPNNESPESFVQRVAYLIWDTLPYYVEVELFLEFIEEQGAAFLSDEATTYAQYVAQKA